MTRWLDDREHAAWLKLAGVLELLPGALDSQLRQDAGLTHFEYLVLAMLSETPGRTLRMTALASRTNATLPRLSHVARRLEERRLVDRLPCPEDARATNARLTDHGWETLVATAPGHVGAVRRYVFDTLAPEQVEQLGQIAGVVLANLDPDGRFAHTFSGRGPDAATEQQPHRPAATPSPSTGGPRD